ncbi:hypothetical protein [uncultured Algibacter sp.]|uniref:hypothetical protein n=1 Tax=uncultured Algibacter sp. TaxID=298659 RepID=UPI00321715A7
MQVKEKFDVDFFKNNSENGKHEYKLDDGSLIIDFGGVLVGEGDYLRVKSSKTSHLNEVFRFYPNGNLKIYGSQFPNKFNCNIWKYYRKDGSIEKEIDYDKGYLFSWQDILDFCKQNDININKNSTSIKKESSVNNPLWIITWSIENAKLKSVVLDAKTGKIIKEEILKIQK